MDCDIFVARTKRFRELWRPAYYVCKMQRALPIYENPRLVRGLLYIDRYCVYAKVSYFSSIRIRLLTYGRLPERTSS